MLPQSLVNENPLLSKVKDMDGLIFMPTFQYVDDIVGYRNGTYITYLCEVNHWFMYVVS